MQQQPQDYKIPHHYTHIQSLLLTLLKQPASKFQTLILTRRTAQLVYSMVKEADLLACGYRKIVESRTINPYMSYQEVVLVFTLSGEEDFEEIAEYGRLIDKVYLINLGICTQQSKSLLKKLQFKQPNSIKGYKEQNLDFFCYLHNTFLLTTRKEIQLAKDNKNKAKGKLKVLGENAAIDRLCSLLFSYENFSEFQFYLPKSERLQREGFAKAVRETMEGKLKVLGKYGYKGLDKNQGMSAVKTRVIVLERTEQISPFILSLYYGPLAEQLNTANSCRFVSVHSTIFNQLYSLDLMSASQKLTQMLSQLSENKKKQISTTNYNETKKILSKAYNPQMSKEELSFHQTLMAEIHKFMESNCELLALEQSIGNRVDELGTALGGGGLVQGVLKWVQQEGNAGKYDRYIGLVVEAFTVHGFWWWQRNQLLAGISDQADVQAIQRYRKGCKVHCLKQKPPKKDQDGSQIRQKCFRHMPNILSQLETVESQIKNKKFQLYEPLKINQEQNSLAKKSRTVVYIHDVIGYNELAMLLALNRSDLEFVCRDVKNTKEWVNWKLFHQ